MPLKFFLTLDGRRVPLDKVQITTTVEDFGLPPADIAALVRNERSRDDVQPEQITASQIGNGARQVYLEEITDYAREPQRLMSAMRGTMRHAMVAHDHDGLVTEQRVVSKTGRYSMKYDSFVPETGILRDKKSVGYFKVLLVLKNGVMESARDYVYQLNLGALLLKQNGQKVTRMFLDFEPQGVGKLEKQELEAKFKITDPSFIPVEVPFLSEADVFDAYERLWLARREARETGTVPQMCDSQQTWGGKKCMAQPGGWSWCPVARECAAVAAERGEAHPLNKSKAVA